VAQKRKILKRLATAAEVAAEAQRLQYEHEAASAGPPSAAEVDLWVTQEALGLFHASITEGMIDAAIAALGDNEGPDVAELLLADLVERAKGYGLATTARKLLDIRAGTYRGPWNAAYQAYSLHCRPSETPPAEARDLLASWVTFALQN
jgi:hypothetical protein